MEHSLLDFNQQKAIKLGLDDRDLLILDFLRKNNNQYNFFIVDPDYILINLKILNYEEGDNPQMSFEVQ